MCPVLPTTSPGMPRAKPPTTAVTQAGPILNPALEVSTTLSACRSIVYTIIKLNLKQTTEQIHLYTILHFEINLFC